MISEQFWEGGPAPGRLHQFPTAGGQDARAHTLTPITTGTSVLGVKFAGGVALAADMLGSYGSLARFRDVPRVMRVNHCSVLGAGGDYADYQHLQAVIEQRVIDEESLQDGVGFTPRALHSWLTRVLYNRRSKFDPLWNTLVVGGVQPDTGVPFLGYVDKIGIAYEDDSIATGFGMHLAQPILRKALEGRAEPLSEAEALDLLDRCMKVLFYRDARSYNKYQVAVVTKDGARVDAPRSSETNWDTAHVVQGF